MNAVVEGTVTNVVEMFFDEFNDPIYPSDSAEPASAILFDRDGSIIQQIFASPTTVPGEWQVDVSVPYMDLTDSIELILEWTMVDTDGNIHKTKHYLQVDPANQNRIADIVVVKRASDNTITFTLPVVLRQGDTMFMDLNVNNIPILEQIDLMALPTKVITASKATFTLPIDADMKNARLEPLGLMCEHMDSRTGSVSFHTRNMWLVTPQIMVAVNMLSNFVDKAKLEQTIPALEYSVADLVGCLYRGLTMFNSYPPHITGFTGINMQGALLDSWLVCSSWIALSTQMLAEGAHSFDFAGQDVNFNVDRTPSIESAIGRLDTQLENQVKPYKKLLAKTGNVTGDGSIGSQALVVGRAMGRTSILNSPTSKLGRGPGGWIRSPLRNMGKS